MTASHDRWGGHRGGGGGQPPAGTPPAQDYALMRGGRPAWWRHGCHLTGKMAGAVAKHQIVPGCDSRVSSSVADGPMRRRETGVEAHTMRHARAVEAGNK
eukprot:COSAG06_NODE_225_length_19768_cov_61.220347_4_plen_100_part_00